MVKNLYKKNYKELKDEISGEGVLYYGETPSKVNAVTTRPEITDQNKIALILCCGKKHFWEEVPRQLWTIDGETILDRLIRQIKDNNVTPVIVTNRKDIVNYLIKNKTTCIYKPEFTRSIAETWLFTAELWREQTLVLLGDTIYPNKIIKEMLEYDGNMRMYGNMVEIFSFSFNSGEHTRVIDTLFNVNREIWKGSPWEIYRKWCGIGYGEGTKENIVFKMVADTADIDSPSEYESEIKLRRKQND